MYTLAGIPKGLTHRKPLWKLFSEDSGDREQGTRLGAFHPAGEEPALELTKGGCSCLKVVLSEITALVGATSEAEMLPSKGFGASPCSAVPQLGGSRQMLSMASQAWPITLISALLGGQTRPGAPGPAPVGAFGTALPQDNEAHQPFRYICFPTSTPSCSTPGS